MHEYLEESDLAFKILNKLENVIKSLSPHAAVSSEFYSFDALVSLLVRWRTCWHQLLLAIPEKMVTLIFPNVKTEKLQNVKFVVVMS